MPQIVSREIRKVSPMAMVSKPYVDDRVLLVEKVKKELGAKARGMHFFFGDKILAEAGRYADQGYVPTNYNHQGDPLLMRPEKEHERHLEQAASDSYTNYEAAASASDDKYRTRLSDGSSIGPSKE